MKQQLQELIQNQKQKQKDHGGAPHANCANKSGTSADDSDEDEITKLKKQIARLEAKLDRLAGGASADLIGGGAAGAGASTCGMGGAQRV